MAERRAGASRDRQHGGDARHNGDVERAPGLRPGLDRLQHRSRHGEHAGIAARDDGDVGAAGGMAQRRLGARALLAVVGPMPCLACSHRNAIEIRPITVKRLRRLQSVVRLLREIARIARAEPDHRKPPAHGRPSQPGTSTMAKYGANVSSLSTSGMTEALAMVPRST